MCLHFRLTVVLTRPVYLHIRHYAHTEYVVVGVVTQHTTRVGARAPISVLGMLATPFFASEHDWKLKDVRLFSCLTKVKNIHISTFTHAVVCVYSMFLCLCTPWLSLVVSCCLWLSLSVSVKSCKGILLCPQVGKSNIGVEYATHTHAECHQKHFGHLVTFRHVFQICFLIWWKNEISF